MIKITVDDKQVQALLSRLSQRAGNLSPIMRAISEDMRVAVEENFETQGASLGQRWKPSARAIRQGGKTLQDTGQLAVSIVKRSTATSAIVGTNKIYAAIHQFGGRTKAHVVRPKNGKALFWPGARHPVKSVNHPGSKIPARPFLGLGRDHLEGIRDRIQEYLMK